MKFPRFPRRICGPRIWDMNLWGVVFAKWHHTTNKLISFTLRKREKNKIQSKKFKPQRRKFAYRASTFSWEIDHESWFKARENIKSKHFVTVKNNFPTLFSYWFRWECRSLRCKMILKFICVHIYVRLLLSLKHSFLSLQIGLYLHDMT